MYIADIKCKQQSFLRKICTSWAKIGPVLRPCGVCKRRDVEHILRMDARVSQGKNHVTHWALIYINILTRVVGNAFLLLYYYYYFFCCLERTHLSAQCPWSRRCASACTSAPPATPKLRAHPVAQVTSRIGTLHLQKSITVRLTDHTPFFFFALAASYCLLLDVHEVAVHTRSPCARRDHTVGFPDVLHLFVFQGLSLQHVAVLHGHLPMKVGAHLVG